MSKHQFNESSAGVLNAIMFVQNVDTRYLLSTFYLETTSSSVSSNKYISNMEKFIRSNSISSVYYC